MLLDSFLFHDYIREIEGCGISLERVRAKRWTWMDESK